MIDDTPPIDRDASRPSGPPAFEVVVRTHDGRTVVAPTGEVDLATVQRVRDTMRAAPGDIVLDLRAVEFLDSSGLRAIIEEDRRAQEAGHRFAIVPGPPAVGRVLDIAGMMSRLDVVDPDTLDRG